MNTFYEIRYQKKKQARNNMPKIQKIKAEHNIWLIAVVFVGFLFDHAKKNAAQLTPQKDSNILIFK